MLLNRCDTKPFDSVNRVGLAITPCRDRPQNHVAILYVYGDVNPQLLHIGVPKGLFRNPPSPHYLWIDLGREFTDIDREIICMHVHKVALVNAAIDPYSGDDLPEDPIKYGFDTDAKYIDPETGLFNPTLKAIGLTCATFVLEVFESCGFTVIDWGSWPRGDKGAITWQREMIKTYLESSELERSYLERQAKNVGNRRYLPEEVVAASQLDMPATKKAVRKKALNFRKELDAHAKKLWP